jgi:hypothetical protein
MELQRPESASVGETDETLERQSPGLPQYRSTPLSAIEHKTALLGGDGSMSTAGPLAGLGRQGNNLNLYRKVPAVQGKP